MQKFIILRRRLGKTGFKSFSIFKVLKKNYKLNLFITTQREKYFLNVIQVLTLLTYLIIIYISEVRFSTQGRKAITKV